jgi:hypothetical protein
VKPDIRTEMLSLLAEIEQALPRATWSRCNNPAMLGPEAKSHKCEAYEAAAGDWYLLAVSFDIEPQGFPPGTRGYDGVGRKGETIIRFTRQLAERAFEVALTDEHKRASSGT